LIEILILIPSIGVTLLFFIYGFNVFYLINAARKYCVPTPTVSWSTRPPIAIHLPIYNEKYVIDRLLAACSNMATSYGKDRVRILILDDSTDETTKEIQHLTPQYLHQGFNIEVLHRTERVGFKAGALQDALEKTIEPYIAVFDADFEPPPHFLSETVQHMMMDDTLGVVQCRWSYLNRQYNFLTKAIAIGMSAHFLIEQPGRYTAQCFLNFNGSGGLIRSQALRDAGGWHSDTLAEDLDASYRMQLHGYRIRYLRDLLAPCEVPPTITSFKRQQGRWACGSLRTAKKLLPQLLRDRTLTRTQKIQAFVHLTYYLVHPLIFTSFLLALVAGILAIDTLGFFIPVSLQLGPDIGVLLAQLVQLGFEVVLQQPLLVIAAALIAVCWSAVWILYFLTLKLEKLSILHHLPSLWILSLLGFGISISNTLQAAKGLLSTKHWSFERTPKYALKQRVGEWRNKSYQVQVTRTFYVELGSIMLSMVTILEALHHGNIGIVVILLMYIASYGFVGILTFMHHGPRR
jgi:cellulose synthase/poly-beta-1,6-N-acetylglucosamine synthase-like glycosyltransferase